MRKRNILLVFVGILILISQAARQDTQAEGATKSTPGQVATNPADAAEPGSQTLVTFVELGSVRCIPCKMMQPVMAEVEKEYGSQVKVVFYDVWTRSGQPYAEKYQIHAIPTQVFLDQDGREFFRHVGFFPKAEIVKVLKKQGVK